MPRNADGETIRVFVAVELPDQVKTEFARLTSAIDSLGVRGVRTVRPRGIHLTLKFLGDVSVELIPEIRSAMDSAAAETKPFDLALGDAGAFPNPAAARVLWVGVQGDLDSLRRLQRRVERSLSELGFRPDRRRFNPHITAARIRDGVSRPDRRKATKALFSRQYAKLAIHARSLSLIQSVLHPDGAIYEPIYTVGLGAA